MSKKQQRYRLPNLEDAFRAGKDLPVSVIMKQGQVFQARIVKVENDILVVSDGLHRLHRLPVSNIEEVIIDKLA